MKNASKQLRSWNTFIGCVGFSLVSVVMTLSVFAEEPVVSTSKPDLQTSEKRSIPISGIMIRVGSASSIGEEKSPV